MLEREGFKGDDEIQVPNLAHIARFLAEHPETADALESAAEALYEQSQNASHWKGIRDYRIDGPLAHMEVVNALVKAMRGEGGHE